MKVVNMEHKLGVKADAAIQHGGIGEKTSLVKKVENGVVIAGKGAAIVKRTAVGIAKNPVVKSGGKAVSTAVAAADKAIGGIDNEYVQLAHKSLHVASGAVRLGGKTVKIACKTTGNVIKNTFKLSRAVAQKVRLAKMKDKPKLKVKTSKLYKTMNAALATKKYVLKPAAKAAKTGVKLGASAAGTVIDKAAGALGSVDNDTAQFAKKAYDVARTAGALTLKAGKGSVRVIKGTGKTARTLLTKKGHRGLVKSVKRSVERIKRTVRNVRNAIKFTVKAAKFIAKMAAKAAKLVAQLVTKLVNLIISTAPWSLIIIAVVVLLIIAVNVVIAICGDETENQTAGLVGKDGNYEELYENLAEFEVLFSDVCGEKVTEPLKEKVSDFCVSVGKPARILKYNDDPPLFPASGKSSSVNKKIEDYIKGSLSKDRYISFLAALKVLTLRETGERPLDAFTQADFEKFIGTVNENNCVYGNTFFIKTTVITDGETCPGANCKTKKKPGCTCCSRTDPKTGKEHKFCGGHGYCDNDHTKMTVTLRTVEEFSGRSIPEVYEFNEDEARLYEGYKEFMGQALEEMNDPDNPYTPFVPSESSDIEIPDYIEPELNVSNQYIVLLAVLVISLIMGLLFKGKKGG